MAQPTDPLTLRLLDENARLRQERNDWMYQAKRRPWKCRLIGHKFAKNFLLAGVVEIRTTCWRCGEHRG